MAGGMIVVAVVGMAIGTMIAEVVAMAVENGVCILKSYGWEANIVKKSDVPKIIPTASEGLLKGVGGRPSDKSGVNGLKALGGVYTIVTNRGLLSIDELKAIIEEVKQKWHGLSMHGDELAHSTPMGCEFSKYDLLENLMLLNHRSLILRKIKLLFWTQIAYMKN